MVNKGLNQLNFSSPTQQSAQFRQSGHIFNSLWSSKAAPHSAHFLFEEILDANVSNLSYYYILIFL
jgi:hypothetical protein